jgi:H+-transporting ATPase
MSDEKAVGAPALDTTIESGGFNNEKTAHGAPATHAAAPTTAKAPAVEDDDDDEDIDALIEDLESQDGHEIEEEEEETATGFRTVPEDMLQTDSRLGLTEAEVIARRRKYGLNQMKEEKENMILKFFSFFIGPIQYVMIVSKHFPILVSFLFAWRSIPSTCHCAWRKTNRGCATQVAYLVCFAHFLFSCLFWGVGRKRHRLAGWSMLFFSCAFSGRRLPAPHELGRTEQLVHSTGRAGHAHVEPAPSGLF